MFHIEVKPLAVRIQAEEGMSLLDCLRHSGIEIVNPCGGKGLCRHCTVQVAGSPDDTSISVLACQTLVERDITVDIPDRTLFAPQQVMVSSTLERSSGGTGKDTRRADRDGPSLGLAVDIGTTTIAGYLIDLVTNATLCAEGRMNPQISHGKEIITRLNFALDNPKNARLLQKRTASALEELLEQLCLSSGSYEPHHVREIVAVGNTAMHHILMNADISRLARAPFISSVEEDMTMKASDLGMSVCKDAWLILPSPVAGFIGSDHIAVLLAIGSLSSKVPMMVLDIGTNTEISLVSGGVITCVSCASGGAFEGTHISSGMTAMEGAIDHIVLEGNDILYHTIGNKVPLGICGSGIFDALAQMVLGGVVDSSGKIRENHPRVGKGQKGREFILVEDVERDMKISVTQQDVRALQLAKAAISTGIRSLLQEVGLRAQEVVEIVIAGGFGSYLDVQSAIAIGMLPDLPAERFRQVGNAAGVGARNFLLSRNTRMQWRKLKKKIRHIELAKMPGFQKMFLSEMSLKAWE